MKQSTLHIDYTTQSCEFNNIKITKIIKEYTNLVAHIGISSMNTEFAISITLGDYVDIGTAETKLRLEFKTPHYFNSFLTTNKTDLELFKISKTNFLDIKGI